MAVDSNIDLVYFELSYTDSRRAPMSLQRVRGEPEKCVDQAVVAHRCQQGLLVTEGIIRKALKARITRADVIIYQGEIASLRRFNDDVREVATGFECGIVLKDFMDVKEGDVLEAYETREVVRTEMDQAPSAAPPPPPADADE